MKQSCWRSIIDLASNNDEENDAVTSMIAWGGNIGPVRSV